MSGAGRIELLRRQDILVLPYHTVGEGGLGGWQALLIKSPTKRALVIPFGCQTISGPI